MSPRGSLCPSRHQHLPDVVLSFLNTPLQVGLFLLQYEKEGLEQVRLEDAAFMGKGYGTSVINDFQGHSVCWRPGTHTCHPWADPQTKGGGSLVQRAEVFYARQAGALSPSRKWPLKTGISIHEVTPDRQRPGNSRTKLLPLKRLSLLKVFHG